MVQKQFDIYPSIASIISEPASNESTSSMLAPITFRVWNLPQMAYIPHSMRIYRRGATLMNLMLG